MKIPILANDDIGSRERLDGMSFPLYNWRGGLNEGARHSVGSNWCPSISGNVQQLSNGGGSMMLGGDQCQ